MFEIIGICKFAIGDVRKCGKLKRGKCFPHVGIDFEDAYSEPRQTTTFIHLSDNN